MILDLRKKRNVSAFSIFTVFENSFESYWKRKPIQNPIKTIFHYFLNLYNYRFWLKTSLFWGCKKMLDVINTVTLISRINSIVLKNICVFKSYEQVVDCQEAVPFLHIKLSVVFIRIDSFSLRSFSSRP